MKIFPVVILYFSITGRTLHKEGYYALRGKLEVGKILDKIEKGRYFVIYAARQTGKTSLIQEVIEKLKDDDRYLALYLTFQDFGRKMNDEEFYQQLARILLREISVALQEKGDRENHRPEVEIGECYSEWSFTELLETLHEQITYHLCLFIDEFEDIPQDVLDGFLRTLRGI